MSTYEPADHAQLDEIDKKLKEASKQTSDRNLKVDDLTSRFRELRRRNHFRSMLEEIFND